MSLQAPSSHVIFCVLLWACALKCFLFKQVSEILFVKHVENHLNVRITLKSTDERIREKRRSSKLCAKTKSLYRKKYMDAVAYWPSFQSFLFSPFLSLPSDVKSVAISVGSAPHWTGTWRNTLQRHTTTTLVSSVIRDLRSWTVLNSIRWKAIQRNRPPELMGWQSWEGLVDQRPPQGRTAWLCLSQVLNMSE